jgi:hypothetical protein
MKLKQKEGGGGQKREILISAANALHLKAISRELEGRVFIFMCHEYPRGFIFLDTAKIFVRRD